MGELLWEIAILAWPVSGWVCGYISTPKWMFDDDPFGYLVLLFCGAVCGPFGVFWLFMDRETTKR